MALTTDRAPTSKVKPPITLSTGCKAVRTEASKYSDWDINIIQAISHAESSCQYNATGDKRLTFKRNGRTYGYSMSVLQVRILPGREHCDKHNLKINVRCAYAIWQNQGYGAWTKYNNGDYRKYLK